MENDKMTAADLVSFANLETPESEANLSDEVLNECLYRTICLIAYGNGNGCIEDIDPFVRIEEHHEEEWDCELESMRYDDFYVYDVLLPYTRQYGEQPLVGNLKIPKGYRNALNPVDKIISASRTTHEDEDKDEGWQVFSFIYEIGDSDESRRWACNVAGQLIVNAHIAPFYIGIYDGKPLFEPNTMDDRLWLAFAELKQHQLPGICAVCGKAIDRKRESSGGKPQKTCIEHSNKFQNIKKQLKKEAKEIGDTNMAYADKCEMAARAQRMMQPELNKRMLMFPGKEILSYANVSMSDFEADESEGDQ